MRHAAVSRPGEGGEVQGKVADDLAVSCQLGRISACRGRYVRLVPYQQAFGPLIRQAYLNRPPPGRLESLGEPLVSTLPLAIPSRTNTCRAGVEHGAAGSQPGAIGEPA